MPEPAAAQSPGFAFDIPAQSLDGALRAFAQTTHQQVLFDRDLVKGKRSPGAHGTFSADAGAALLLQGTGLQAVRRSRGAYVITAAPPAPAVIPVVTKPVAAQSRAVAGEILVTARKRAEHIIDIPIAVTAIGGVAIARRGAGNLSDFLQESPGVGIYDYGSGNQKITIRGVSTSLGGNENGYYLDDLPFTGVSVPIAPDVRAWDIDRVEVLRGPQGTLFGEGSMGGTVRILARDADLDGWAVGGETLLSVTEGGGANRGIKALANIPLVPDMLAIRLSGTSELYDGWINDAATGRQRVNSQAYDSFRAKLRLDPSDRLSINGSYWRYRGSFPDGGSSATDANQLPQSGIYASALNYDLYGANVRYDLGRASLFYGYSHDSFALPQQGSLLGGTLKIAIDIRLDAHEMRLASQGIGPLQWTIGAYQRTALRQDASVFDVFPADNLTRTHSKAQALFGEGTYTLATIPIDLTFGLRYFHDALRSTEFNFGEPTVLPGSPAPGANYSSFNPRFNVAWRPDPGVSVYASAAKGFRSGQLQPSLALQLAGSFGIALPAALKQDSIWTYELGAKAQLPGGRVQIEAAAYVSDWRDVAVRIPIADTGLTGIVNSNGTHTRGIEASISADAGSGLSLSASASYIDAAYVGTVPGTGIVDGGQVEDVAAFTANATIDYRRRLNAGAAINAQVNYQHSSPRAFTSSALSQPGDRINRVDARVGIDLPWVGLSLFVDNLTNEGGAVGYRSVTRLPGGAVDIAANRLRPRTVGVRANFAFDRPVHAP